MPLGRTRRGLEAVSNLGTINPIPKERKALMSLTRRDAIKAAIATAAVAATPLAVKAAIAAKPPTKVESIYARIKELISRCEKERDLPFDPQWDSIIISLPRSFDISDINATSTRFRNEYPTWRWGGFKFFKFTTDGLEVKIFRVVDADDGCGLYKIDQNYCCFATMFFDNGQIVAGKF